MEFEQMRELVKLINNEIDHITEGITNKDRVEIQAHTPVLFRYTELLNNLSKPHYAKPKEAIHHILNTSL
ncbi:hypothetical protein JOD82_002284 [Paenibacillus sp. 1182]|uniref:hypothetical protein n=1 Tax=Paenibacillus sp. 1182 TaxID=2806565 RepID=UPI001AE7425D|nr:hypothetical protein [Paenibacillus sp. 1182]MBP1309264.1 hypothetical protein [Paenibacillus sp. 1182]